MASRKKVLSPENTPPERIAKFLAEQAKDNNPPKRRKLKECTTEKIADLYLKELAKEGDIPVFLNEFLDEQGIFCTYESITECLELLTKNGFIKQTKLGFSIFKISKAKNIWIRRLAEGWRIPQCVITDAGLHFSSSGQELDSSSKESKREEKKKWRERRIQWISTIVIGILMLFVKDCYDKRNESSHLRSGIDQGQRPEHR
jgi:hypothetical protein